MLPQIVLEKALLPVHNWKYRPTAYILVVTVNTFESPLEKELLNALVTKSAE